MFKSYYCINCGIILSIKNRNHIIIFRNLHDKKLHLMKKLYSLIFLLTIQIVSYGQGLSPGDLAVIGMNAGPDGYSTPSSFTDPTRQFAIVALAAIPANEEIFITDRGWINGSPGSFISQNFDGTIKFVPSAVIPAGTVMIFKLDASTASNTISVS